MGRTNRKQVVITYRGRTLTVAAWADETGLRAQVIRSRLARGWTHDEIFSTPIHDRKARKYEHDGKQLTLHEWASECGIGYETLRNRLDIGWTIDRALSTPVRVQRKTKHK